MMQQDVHYTFEFDEKNYKPYNTFSTAFVLLCLIVTIPLLPFWFLMSSWYNRAWLDNQECVVLDKSLFIKQGIFFKSEKNIPFDKITDVTLKQGPLARQFNIFYLTIETAGNSSGMPEGTLIGVKEPHAVREMILAQRDSALQSSSIQKSFQEESQDDTVTLKDILDVLKRIEAKLK
mgnify:CR=1 FL=1